MAVTNAFREAVSSGNTMGVRIMMKDSLLVDLTFSEFEEMSRIAQSMSGLYDSHDGRGFETDKANWNDAYMDKLMVQVVGNFSHERLEHLKEVVRYLHPAPAKPTKPTEQDDSFRGTARQQYSTEPSSSAYRRQKEEDMRNGRIIKIVGGATVGAVVGGAIAAVAGATGGTIAGAAVAGAAVVGGIAAATANEGR